MGSLKRLLAIGIGVMIGTGTWPTLAPAVQRIDVVDDGVIPVTVSSRDMNVITAPAPVLNAYTSKPEIEVKAQGRHVFVTTGSTPGELVILTEQRVYVLQLQPRPMPAETVILTEHRVEEGSGHAAGLEPAASAADYVDELLSTMRSVFVQAVPSSMQVSDTPEAQRLTWLELTVVRDQLYQGAAYLFRRIEWRNDTALTHTLRERSLFTGRELAIGVDRWRIDPGQSAVAVLVYPASRARAKS